MAYYLGLDSSTQSLSAIVIDSDSGEVVLDKSIQFGADLPQYKSPNGFLESDDPLVRHSDPMMWVDALDLLCERAKADGFDWSKVAGISGSGQQHGSVYLNETFLETVKSLTADKSLAEQLKPTLSRPSSPIWMDSSTNQECREIAEAAGGNEKVRGISGSAAIERFTGPQIRKFSKTEPEAYAKTARIHLVSSFMASVVAGGDAGIDTGDGAGMNLMDLATSDWSDTLLEATAPDLRTKLPPVVGGGSKVGEVSKYLVDKYGFTAGTPVIAWSGDNPCSLVGMGATAPGTAVISLGTSDTFFAAMSKPLTDPNGYGHVFGSPAGGFMCLMCFKNGSLAREKVMEKLGMDYDAFSKAILGDTKAGNDGNIMFPYYESEITPLILEPAVKLEGDDEFAQWKKPPAVARAIVEAQAMSMKIHSAWIGETPTIVRVTGGASKNDGIVQVLADVFGAKLQRLAVSNSAGLGAALMAAHGAAGTEWSVLFDTFAKAAPGVVEPADGSAAVYEDAAKTFGEKLKAAFGLCC
jgi:xylulokinase